MAKHVHKYHRLELYGTKVWACALPDCNHYMPAHLSKMVPGKNTVCWGCDEVMILDPINMRDDQPQCADCNGMKSLIQMVEKEA